MDNSNRQLKMVYVGYTLPYAIDELTMNIRVTNDNQLMLTRHEVTEILDMYDERLIRPVYSNNSHMYILFDANNADDNLVEVHLFDVSRLTELMMYCNSNRLSRLYNWYTNTIVYPNSFHINR